MNQTTASGDAAEMSNQTRTQIAASGSGCSADSFQVIWPEVRTVSAEQIRTWYLDAVDNGETEISDHTDVRDMARELQFIGHITLKYGYDQ